MKLSTALRRLLCGCAVVSLLVFAWGAIVQGLPGLFQGRTVGQRLETVLQLACGLLSVAVVVTRFRWRSASRPLRIAWTATLAGSAGLSALVWGPPMPKIAALFVGVALLLAWAVLWALGPALAT